MGIKGLGDIKKNNSPLSKCQMPLSVLKGKKVAIDVHNVLYANLSVVQKMAVSKTDVTTTEIDSRESLVQLFRMMLTQALKWLDHDIVPIFVFEGRAPIEKADELEQRKEKREEKEAEIEELKLAASSFDVFEKKNETLTRLRKLMASNIRPEGEDITFLFTVLSSLGLPCVQAKGEGEQLCSMLALEGVVAAVYCNDYDCLAYGTNILIHRFVYGARDEQGAPIVAVEITNLPQLLSDLQMNQATFLELCIMLGCDYNTNIPNYGPVKSLKLIREYGTIDNIGKTGLDISYLKHETCRRMFKKVSSIDLIEIGRLELVNPFTNVEATLEIRELLDSVKLGDMATAFARSMQNITPSKKIKLSLIVKDEFNGKEEVIVKPKLKLRILGD